MIVAPGIIPARGLAAIVYDALATDSCLAPYLDHEQNVTHGTEDWCDEPTSTHSLPPVRREQKGWPGHFSRAIVTFGRWGKRPFFGGSNRPNLEDWEFIVSVFARTPIILDNGMNAGPGDIWAMEIYHHVVRILGWNQEAPVGQTCGPDFLVARRFHIGDTLPLSWMDERSWWQIATRFRWTVLSRGLIAPPPCVPCGQSPAISIEEEA